jgi:flagellar M-ring protein FliF
MPEVPDETETEDSAPAPVLKRRFRSTGPTLRDELTSMVKEDPDTAANVLRNWIGDAA